MRPSRSLALALALALTVACGDEPGSDGGIDAALDSGAEAGPSEASTPDAGIDAGRDAGPDDAGSDAGRDAGADAGPLPVAEELADYLDALCDQEVRCANQPERLGTIDVTSDACHPWYFLGQLDRWNAGLVSGRLVSAAMFDACIADLATECATPPSCARPFSGTVGMDGACYLDIECETGLYCISGGACPSTCQPPRAEGELCGGATSCGIEEGYCPGRYPPADTYCVRRPAIGEACESTAQCRSDGYCEGDVCVARVSTGDPCTPAIDAYSPECPYLDACVDDGTGTTRCKSIVDLVEGDGCGAGFPRDCPPDTACVTVGGEKTCVRGVAIGEACDSTTPCARASRCIGGTCIAVVHPGEPCGPDVACTDWHVCGPTDRCIPRPAFFEACSSSLPCISGECAADGVCRPTSAGAAGARCTWGDLEGCQEGLECREDMDGRSYCTSRCDP